MNSSDQDYDVPGCAGQGTPHGIRRFQGRADRVPSVWALKLGPLGITVNAIGPGPIATEPWAMANDPERARAIVVA